MKKGMKRIGVIVLGVAILARTLGGIAMADTPDEVDVQNCPVGSEYRRSHFSNSGKYQTIKVSFYH